MPSLRRDWRRWCCSGRTWKNCSGVSRVGAIARVLFIAIAMASGGAGWDNVKNFIEEGHLGGQASFAFAVAGTGDTVGDPYKDTACPAINPMIKVVNILAILIISIFF